MRNWEPRRMRRTVGPLPGCAVITSAPLSTRAGYLCRPSPGLHPRTCNLTVSSARAFGLAFARYTGDDSACAASARLKCKRPRASDTDGKADDRTPGGTACDDGGERRDPGRLPHGRPPGRAPGEQPPAVTPPAVTAPARG